ncbi:hypothetical protein NQ315_007662 [Exocentrus adspersus]|uniref:Galectin domain-containing protein n=1 Tax=Exocentrus adspersus TaxID=1586481 RepID=A0AAV8W7K1_9CUCU|nr:hypothetical protein NQ315_007662 [Exocentrus adspersus]
MTMDEAVEAYDYLVVQCEDKTSQLSHLEHLPNALQAGSCISIRGLIKPDCTRFAINLLCGQAKDSDIAVHINPRISQRYVVRNSRIRGKWSEEETTCITKFELARSKKFHVDIVASEKEFLVSMNGKHVCAYVFRVVLAKITTLQVEGMVDIDDVQYKKVQIYPQIEGYNVTYTVPTGDGRGKDAVQQLRCSSSELDCASDEVPVTALLPKGFQKHWQLVISGRVKILPYSFYINLQKGSQLWPHPVVPLHLNPRFGKNSFIRNSWHNGKWGKEECSPSFPFIPGQPFNLAISRNEDNFAVWVDGKLSGEFLYRDKVEDIDTVYIHGDVTIKSMYMREGNDKYFRPSPKREVVLRPNDYLKQRQEKEEKTQILEPSESFHGSFIGIQEADETIHTSDPSRDNQEREDSSRPNEYFMRSHQEKETSQTSEPSKYFSESQEVEEMEASASDEYFSMSQETLEGLQTSEIGKYLSLSGEKETSQSQQKEKASQTQAKGISQDEAKGILQVQAREISQVPKKEISQVQATEISQVPKKDEGSQSEETEEDSGTIKL